MSSSPRWNPFLLGVSPRTAPRKLTTHQKAVLIHVLTAFPEQQAGIRYDPDVPDARAYAQDFLAVFKAIGWEVKDPEPTSGLAANSSGLALAVRDESDVPTAATALRDALRIYGIEAEFVVESSQAIPPGGFVLVVGATA
jgi:hypothetical protein